VGPFYRYHEQTGADYFATFRAHRLSDVFHSSGFDLSAFHSHKYGITFRYSSLYGILRTQPLLEKKKILMLKYLEMRIGHCERTTGLKTNFVSLNLGFAFK
jgi:hypothetical protein